ncbi:hypothetical protein VIGAN_04201100 [Vigna angularis var. angularis]|uniref:Uncharacterized protein n=1 Tax=Vigna angularis var. angularis TaxID=157739 RepID=A0A0S3RVH7_PHAAN|nr:hypothetical protein VIGAN_04201100 [Vigna angularis var. angularis]
MVLLSPYSLFLGLDKCKIYFSLSSVNSKYLIGLSQPKFMSKRHLQEDMKNRRPISTEANFDFYFHGQGESTKGKEGMFKKA